MKKILLLILVLCLPIAFATGTQLEVYSFKVYADGKQINADWQDDGFKIEPDTEIEVQTRFRNLNNNDSVEIDMNGVLFDIGSNIERQETLTVSPGQKDAIVFTYFIPAGTSEGFYDLDLSYNFKYNGESVSYDVDKTFQVDVRKKVVDLNDILINITQQLADEKARSNDIYSELNDVSGLAINFSTCQSKLSVMENKEELYNEYKVKYNNLSNEYISIVKDKATCDADKKNMVTQETLTARVAAAKREGESQGKKESNNNLMLFAAIGWGLWQMKKKEKKVGGGGVASLEIAKGW